MTIPTNISICDDTMDISCLHSVVSEIDSDCTSCDGRWRQVNSNGNTVPLRPKRRQTLRGSNMTLVNALAMERSSSSSPPTIPARRESLNVDGDCDDLLSNIDNLDNRSTATDDFDEEEDLRAITQLVNLLSASSPVNVTDADLESPRQACCHHQGLVDYCPPKMPRRRPSVQKPLVPSMPLSPYGSFRMRKGSFRLQRGITKMPSAKANRE